MLLADDLWGLRRSQDCDLRGPREVLSRGGSLRLLRFQGCNLQGLEEIISVSESCGHTQPEGGLSANLNSPIAMAINWDSAWSGATANTNRCKEMPNHSMDQNGTECYTP